MKIPHLPLVICLSGCLLSCSAKKNPDFLTHEQLSKIQNTPTLKAKQITIHCKIIESDGSVKSLPKVTTKVGQIATVQLYREFIYPTTYDLPKAPRVSKDQHVFPVTPSKPKQFATKNLGTFLTLTPTIRGSLIEIKGTMVHRSADTHVYGAGEAYSPISVITKKNQEVVITENKASAPEFTEITNTILVCGRPNVEHTMYLKNQKRKLVFTMKVAK